MVEEKRTLDVRSEVMRTVLNISKSLAKEKQGALFVIADRAKITGNYRPHYPQIEFTGNLLSKGMDAVIEKLAIGLWLYGSIPGKLFGIYDTSVWQRGDSRNSYLYGIQRPCGRACSFNR